MDFLEHITKFLKIKNISIIKTDALNHIKSEKNKNITIVGRGFTGKNIFSTLIGLRKITAIFLITSDEKIKILKNDLVKTKTSVYNIQNRDIIKILKMENVSRETKRKKM